MTARRSASAPKLAALFALYFAQGLPFGFQATALPVYLRESGVSLTGVGLAGVLAAPWSFKVLWAPVVERFGGGPLGRRRSWIVPLQALLAATCGIAAAVPPDRGLAALLALVLAMNFFAATQDIAVDGLAVDVIAPHELGPANAAQVVGYKVGMLTGGGLLVWASQWIGWRGLFGGMAALVLLAMLAAFAIREPAVGAALGRARRSMRDVVADVLDALRAPGALWLVAFAATYKIGESMVDAMFKPFLVDAGFSKHDIGLWIGTWGMAASIVGSLAGGVLAARAPLLGAVLVTAVLRAASVGGEWYLAAAGPPDAGAVIVVTIAEHAFGGALTTAMFAFLMSRVRKSVGAAHFTLLASAEVIGKAPSGLLSGVLAERIGYAPLFALGTALSVAFLVLLLPLRERRAEGAG